MSSRCSDRLDHAVLNTGCILRAHASSWRRLAEADRFVVDKAELDNLVSAIQNSLLANRIVEIESTVIGSSNWCLNELTRRTFYPNDYFAFEDDVFIPLGDVEWSAVLAINILVQRCLVHGIKQDMVNIDQLVAVAIAVSRCWDVELCFYVGNWCHAVLRRHGDAISPQLSFGLAASAAFLTQTAVEGIVRVLRELCQKRSVECPRKASGQEDRQSNARSLYQLTDKVLSLDSLFPYGYNRGDARKLEMVRLEQVFSSTAGGIEDKLSTWHLNSALAASFCGCDGVERAIQSLAFSEFAIKRLCSVISSRSSIDHETHVELVEWLINPNVTRDVSSRLLSESVEERVTYASAYGLVIAAVLHKFPCANAALVAAAHHVLDEVIRSGHARQIAGFLPLLWRLGVERYTTSEADALLLAQLALACCRPFCIEAIETAATWRGRMGQLSGLDASRDGDWRRADGLLDIVVCRERCFNEFVAEA